MLSMLQRALGATVLSVGLGLAVAATAQADPGVPDPSAPVPGLGITAEQFGRQGSLAADAAAIRTELADDPGFGYVALRGDQLVIIGQGAGVQAAAANHGAAVDSAKFNAKARNATAMKQLLESEGVTEFTAVLETTDGIVVGAKDPAKTGPRGKSAKSVANELGNVKVVADQAFRPFAVQGGQGYSLNNAWLCSVGFPGYDGNGNRIIISAGHCSGGKTGWSTAYQGSYLGTVNAAIFGDQTSGNDTWGTDFLTIGGVSQATEPKVDHYDGTSSYVTGSVDPVVGMKICKSGVTTKFTCGSVTATGWVYVTDGTTGHYVYSAMSDAAGSQGDSGGAWVSGNKAVGVTSSGGQTTQGPRTNAAILKDFFSWQPSSQLAIYLPEPNVNGAVSSATWSTGTTVSGVLPTLPGDTWPSTVKVVVKVDGTVVANAPVASNGSYSFTYNGAPGNHTVTLQAVSGYSSGPVRTLYVSTNAPQTITNALFKQMSPIRLVDTRQSSQVPANGSLTVQVAGANGIPTNGVVSAALNLTVTNSRAAGYAVAYPTGSPMPGTSSINFVDKTVANMVTVRVGDGGKVTITNASPAPIDMVVDLTGYYLQSGTTGGSFAALTPSRFLDTRQGFGWPSKVAGGATATVRVTGDNGVPTTGVAAVLVNLTVTNTAGAGHETAWAGTTARPNVSSVNWERGETRANMAVVPVAPDGTISLYNGSNASVDFIADIAGFYTSGTATQSGAFNVVTPTRVLETRLPYGGTGTLAPQAKRTVDMTKAGVPATAGAVVVNVTALNATAAGYGTLYPSNTAVPATSTVNFIPGATVPNLAATAISGGTATLLNGSTGSTDYLADVQGWFLA